MLKHQQWRKKYEERRKNYIEWIGEDTNHGQITNHKINIVGTALLNTNNGESGLVRTPTTDKFKKTFN